ncbi:hypothetical protein SASPL_110760 [Salvia splendens]|uniref:beta-carotene 3-hydroxylase n=1 Tax=Salvia splendens TaxID=180675 RepID=A0A8X8Y6R2_SALSN|nr:hypothetical protein SASPL_110760 [Salvia splendens]
MIGRTARDSQEWGRKPGGRLGRRATMGGRLRHNCNVSALRERALEEASDNTATPRTTQTLLQNPPSMAAGISFSTTPRPILRSRHSPRPALQIPPPLHRIHGILRRPNLTVCFVLEDEKLREIRELEDESGGVERAILLAESVAEKVAEKLARKKSERFTYLMAAVMSSFGITSMAIVAGGEIPYTEMFGTFALSVGAAVGMEFWARWAHKALWHASLWHMHEGLGITVFGIAYMFVHDGLVHRRFPVGPIAEVPYFRKVASAHQLHHTDKFNGVPYGLFLGPKELEEVGGLPELEEEINRRIKLSKKSR